MSLTEALKVMELSANFCEADLKKAYREAMMVWHPDRFEGNASLKAKAASKTALINNAKSVLQKHLATILSEPPQRSADPFGKTASATPKPEVPPQETAPKQPPESNQSPVAASGESWVQRNPGRSLVFAGFVLLFIGGALGLNGDNGGTVLGFVAGGLMIIGFIVGFSDKDKLD